MVEPLVITQDPERDTVTIDGVVYDHVGRRLDPDPDLTALDLQHRDRHVIADVDGLLNASRENEHRHFLLMMVNVPFSISAATVRTVPRSV